VVVAVTVIEDLVDILRLHIAPAGWV
jgi:hypothetical protein